MKSNPIRLITILLAGVLLCSELFAEESRGQIPFQELPKETRDILAPLEKYWHKVKPNQQKWILARAQSAAPSTRERVRRMAQRLKDLSPEQRKRLRKIKKHYDKMSPDERQKLRQRYENTSPQERR